MKINPGLRFIVLILIMVGAAMAVRAFEVNKRGDRMRAFTLTMTTRVRLVDPAGFENKLKTNSKSYDVCFREKQDGQDQPLHEGDGNPPKCESKSGPPHIQQTMAFDNIKNLKAIVDSLTTRAAPPVSNPSGPETSATPAPHVSQQVESHTPQAAKAIAAALGH